MLTNFDLEERAKSLVIPLVGVYSKDLLPPMKKDGGYIINLQDSVDEHGMPLPGTHWTSFWVEKRAPAVYFDSFGVLPPKSVQKFLGKYIYSTKQIQNIQSEICGYYALYFIWFMHTHRHKIKSLDARLKVFLRQFSSDVTQNKRLLQKYIKPL